MMNKKTTQILKNNLLMMKNSLIKKSKIKIKFKIKSISMSLMMIMTLLLDKYKKSNKNNLKNLKIFDKKYPINFYFSLNFNSRL